MGDYPGYRLSRNAFSQTVYVTQDQSEVLQKLEPMHIFLSVIGEKNVPRLLNNLKSLFCYQNRVRHDRGECLISIRNATVLPCSRNGMTVSRREIHLHLLVDEETRGSLYSNLSQWKLQNFTWTIYPTEEHFNLTNMSQKLEPVRIFLSMIREKNVPRLLNTLKSSFYYQNRVRHDREGCLISIQNAAVLPCSRNRMTVSRREIHLHLLVDEETRGSLYSNLSQWKLQNFTWTICPIEKHLVLCFFEVARLCHLLENVDNKSVFHQLTH
ncbi:hypothetical protein FGIG_11768 [Fasciola gigantica]|uniref:Uncharacterized protein n=1 Tax=Fasciola gigantica TaxID=46835 RepID=A0A504YCN3_FASGI|nr:hypothetical protein FGIG_11768 [Fasciola gigantica]